MDLFLNNVPVTTKSEDLEEGCISGHSDSDVPGFDGQHNEGERMSRRKPESGTLVLGFLSSISSHWPISHRHILKLFWIGSISVWSGFKGIVLTGIKVMLLFTHPRFVPTLKNIWRRGCCFYHKMNVSSKRDLKIVYCNVIHKTPVV